MSPSVTRSRNLPRSASYAQGMRWALVAVATLGVVPSAWANSRFPSTDQLVVNPQTPSHMVVRATFGMIATEDAGQSWGYVCEAGIGYADYEPAIAITPTGTVIAALNDGVAVSSEGMCGWDKAAEIGNANVVDVSVSRSEPNVSVAIAHDVLAQESRYYESRDDGQSYQVVGSVLPQNIEALTVDVAPSDPNRLYVSGLIGSGDAATGVLARSDDRGETWTVYDAPDTDEVYAPFIAAVHPTDPDTVYVRLDGGPGRLYLTDDGGETLTPIWEAPIGNLLGFALSPDGSEILVGNDFDGVFRANAEIGAFERVSDLPIRCLQWAETGVYACVNSVIYNHGFIVARSDDKGVTFDPLLELACVRPLTCAEETRAGFFCRTDFDELGPRIDADTCGGGAAGGSGGQGGAGGAGGASLTEPPQVGGGCAGCVLSADDKTETSPWPLWLAGLVVALRRTARRR